jgi:hypothetical protein
MSVFADQFTRAGSTFSLADLPTSGMILAPAPNYSGPIQVMIGQYDFTFCAGDCSKIDAVTTGLAQTFYPSAKAFDGHIVADSGHCINNHYAAPQAFKATLAFLKEQGL